MKKVILASAFVSLFSASVFAESRSIEYGEINEILDLIHNQAKSDYILSKFHLDIKDDALALQDIKLWLEQDGKVIGQGSVDTEGNIDLPILPQKQAENVKLVINQPKGAVAINVATDIAPLTRQQVSYQELFVLLDDVNEFTSLMAGGLSWFVPSMDKLEFTFAAPAEITFTDEKGRNKVFKTDSEHKIEVPMKSKWMKLNPTLQFSALPEKFAPMD
ncbi:DUF2987 domain-containing protein [Pseudoalteromonas sp. T1lg65]|uniref:DUF2987 domain-containing protein n=1 Tax=Pseudoalteromonas sp. T1lg65 TaxID=2077101 RepID=UPI003F7B0260